MRKYLIFSFLLIAVFSVQAEESSAIFTNPSMGNLKQGDSVIITIYSDYDFLYLIFQWDEGLTLEVSHLDYLTEEPIATLSLIKGRAVYTSIYEYLLIELNAVGGEGSWYCYTLSEDEGVELGFNFSGSDD